MKKPIHYQTSYRRRLRQVIEAWSEPVFTRRDLATESSHREQLRLNRALRAFIDEGFIIKVSHGVYAKARIVSLPNGDTKIATQQPFETVAIATLNKRRIKWELGSAIQAYNRGETTQVPVIFTIKLRSRFRGSIKAAGRCVYFEGSVNAR